MSLGRSAIPLPVLRYSSAGTPVVTAAMYFQPGYEDSYRLAGAQPNTLNPASAPTYDQPSYEDTMALADAQPTHYLEPQ